MRYYILDSNRKQAGPYSSEELHQMHLDKRIGWDTEVRLVGEVAWGMYREIAPGRTSAPPPLPERGASLSAENFANRAQGAAVHPPKVVPQPIVEDGSQNLIGKVSSDISTIWPHLVRPFQAFFEFKWAQDKRLLGFAAIGVLPLTFITFFQTITSLYWAVAIYFSVLWAMFFRHMFEASDVKDQDCVISFAATALIGISFLMWLQQTAVWDWLKTYEKSPALADRLFFWVVSVGFAEELSKALILFVMADRVKGLPRSLMVLGLMSGLGFGIYEGVSYQTGHNLQTFGEQASKNFVAGAAGYYYSNMLRLTSLPFLHAIWTAMAGYFIGVAKQHPGHRHGLWVAAIMVPAILHGVYDMFSNGILGPLLMLVSVVVLMLYLAHGHELDAELSEHSGRWSRGEQR